MIEIKKSKFYSYKFTVHSESETESFIEYIKKEHKKATHIVYAFILSSPHIEKFSDDGEPSRLAGYPILNVLKKRVLSDTLVVIARYFGGIKLGAGGLVRAYVKAAGEVL